MPFEDYLAHNYGDLVTFPSWCLGSHFDFVALGFCVAASSCSWESIFISKRVRMRCSCLGLLAGFMVVQELWSNLDALMDCSS